VRAPLANGHSNASVGELVVVDRPASGSPDADRPNRGRGLITARAVLKVLSFVAQHPEGVGARDVAKELGKSVSTAYDLLASLYEEGFAVHVPGHGYRLAAEVAIGRPAPEATHHRVLSRAVDDLFARTHRRSYLARVEAGAIVITAVCGRQGIPKVPGLERRIRSNAHALAIGKVVLSLLPEQSRWRYIQRGLRVYTPRTIASPAALMSEFERVRTNGLAIDRGEFHLEYCTVAAPILDPDGRLRAVLGLSSLSRAFEAEAQALVAAVREEAAAAACGRVHHAGNDIRALDGEAA
jgi:acetyl-CoA synthetase